MKQKLGGLIRCIIISVFVCMIANISFAETVNYTYDDLNRLIRAEYGNDLIIEYAYDEVGNRIQHIINNPNDTIPPTTAASPPGGTYNTSQSVILTCSDAGSGCDKIYYTTDGSTPTTSSSVYSSPITISATTTLKYFATDLAGNSEAVKSQTYITDTTLPTTTATPPGGTYNAVQTVTLTCVDANCDKIYYTTDGSTPTTSSNIYSTPITISETTMLQYFAADLAGNNETVKSQTYIIDTISPTGAITINSGATATNSTNVALTISCNDSTGCAETQFSDDNINWSAVEAYAAAKAWTLVEGDGTKTVYVKLKDTAGNWSAVYSDAIILDTTAPDTAISPAGGVYTSAQTIILTCSDAGSGCDKIYYTTDGSTPTTSSSVYSSPITISATTTLKYFATDLAGNSEAVKSQTYITDTTLPTTTATPPGGTYNAVQTVTLTCVDANCDKIYYTTDGSTPTTSSNIYSTPITISATTTLKYFATDLAGNSEAVKSQTYIIDTISPTGTITINGGVSYTNNTNISLTLSCSDNIDCSQMKFSNDNLNWSEAETYTSAKAWTLVEGNGVKTVYVKFKDTDGNWSNAYSDTIILDTIAPVTSASLIQPDVVALTCSDAGSGCDKIYYTTDGSTPTTSSSVYSSPITISATTTLKYFATDLAGNSEAVKSQIQPTNVIRILRTPDVYYSALQDAYNAATDGDIIQAQAVNLTGNLNANKNISVSLHGGYNSDFTITSGNTILKGMIQTFAGSGTITIGNFVLEK